MAHKNEFWWFAFHYQDFFLDTHKLSDDELGVYVRLMVVYYMDGKPLIGDLKILAKEMHFETKKRKNLLKKVIELYFKLEDKFFVHPRIDKELKKMSAISETKRIAGKKGATKRWNNDLESDSICHNSAIPSAIKNAWQTDAQITYNKKDIISKRKSVDKFASLEVERGGEREPLPICGAVSQSPPLAQAPKDSDCLKEGMPAPRVADNLAYLQAKKLVNKSGKKRE